MRQMRPIPVAAIAFLLGLMLMNDRTRAEDSPSELTRERASNFARLALKGIGKEYPNKLEHVMAGPDDVKGPKALHPAFFGSYDWHSSVHGHWMLVRLLRTFPDLPEAREIRDALDAHLTPENLAAEADYFRRKESRPFERPYGWAWLLKLAEELHGWDDPSARRWRSACARSRRSWPRATWNSSPSRRTRSAPASTRTLRSA